MADMKDRLRLQREEFEACATLAVAYRNLPAPVDDGYPAARLWYDRARNAFITACKNNEATS